MKKALITGIAGFAGSHLAEYLISKNIKVFGFYHPHHSTENLDSFKQNISLLGCDVLNKKKLKSEIKTIDPDLVFHLAAFSSPAESFQNAHLTLKNNILGQLNLLEVLKDLKSSARILIIGSADEYGNVKNSDLPINEQTTLAPVSPYAVSKVAQDLLGWQFFLHHRLNIVRVRPFNHIGPRQSGLFAISSFAAQIATLEKKGGGVIKVGNLKNKRDFTDVRDMVRAYLLALEKGKLGEVYNIGSGKAYKMVDVLKMMISMAKVKINVKVDKSHLHSQDIKIIFCDFSKFNKQTGWSPTIPIKKTLFDTIEYERNKLKWSRKEH